MEVAEWMEANREQNSESFVRKKLLKSYYE